MSMCIKNLIRLYYCYNGNFDNISTCNFYKDVVEDFELTSFEELNDYLYNALGYKHNNSLPSFEVFNRRKEFCKKSYQKEFLRSLMSGYQVKNLTELTDLLDSKGILGIQKQQISKLSGYKSIDVPSKFINRSVYDALTLVENYLDDNEVRPGVKFVSLKTQLLIDNDVNKFMDTLGIDISEYFEVKFTNDKLPKLVDGVLYMKDTGYGEELTRLYLIKLYLLGMSTLPLYLRDRFVAIIPRCLSFGTIDDLLLNLLDISFVSDVSPRKLMEVFGFSFANPEVMWRDYNGFFFMSGNDRVFYCNKTSELFLDLATDEFLKLVNSRELMDLNVTNFLSYRKLESLNKSNMF